MIIKNISKVIQETLKARERALARKTKYALQGETAGTLDISDMASRTTFVRMISNKETPVIMQGGDFGNDYITDDNSGKTQFGFNSDNIGIAAFGLYQDTDDMGMRPISGIKDISVEYKGGYKAIRQATINWTANSIEDLDRLTPHFLTIGKTMLLDWGWIMKSGIKSNFFQEGKILDEAFSNPMPLILENEGNYDAMAGVISNFGYDLNDSGGFDCVTTLTSVGVNLFDSQSTTKGSSEFKSAKKENGDVGIEAHKDGLINALMNLPRILTHDYFNIPVNTALGSARGDWSKVHIQAQLNQDTGGEGDLLDQIFFEENDRGNLFIVTKKQTNEAEANAHIGDVFFCSSPWRDPDNGGRSASRMDFYVRWGWFEDNILSRYTSYTQEGTNKLVNTFRSIELNVTKEGAPQKWIAPAAKEKALKIDDNGNFVIDPNSTLPALKEMREKYENVSKEYLHRSVLIKNNKDYLLPLNPMKCFLPDQRIKRQSLEITKAPSDKNNILYLHKRFYDAFLKINDGKPFVVTEAENKSYGALRNIMVSVIEIQRAFGIKSSAMNDGGGSGQVHGSDAVNPPTTVKAGLKTLFDNISSNFHNFWDFEIVSDPTTGNMKVIDKNSTFNLDIDENQKRYSTFKDNSHKIKQQGIFKFPSFQAGSIVKTQNLSFKIPDSMAVTAMYGSNKSKEGSGVTHDPSNENYKLESVFSRDKGDVYLDKKLKNLQKAYQINFFNVSANGNGEDKPAEGHNIGVPETNVNLSVTMDGSFNITPSKPWWSTWVESQPDAYEKTQTDEGQKELEKLETLTNEFNYDVSYVLQGHDKKTAAVVEYDPETRQPIMSLELNVVDKTLNGQYYIFGKDAEDDAGFNVSLFSGGAAVVRTNLYSYSTGNTKSFSNDIIPAELSLTVDGIGGIIPGDIIQTDYIQPKYNTTVMTADEKEKGPFTFFQIFGLTQKVSSDGWETELTTKMRINNDVLELEASGKPTFFVEATKPKPDPGVGHIPGQAEEARIAEGTTTHPMGNYEPNYGFTTRKGISTMGQSQNTYDILKLKPKINLEYTPDYFHASDVRATRRERELGIEHAGDAPITPLEAGSLDGEPQPQFTPFIPFDKNTAVANMFKLPTLTLGQPGVQFSSVQTRTPFMPDRIIEKLESEGSGDDADVKIIQLSTGCLTALIDSEKGTVETEVGVVSAVTVGIQAIIEGTTEEVIKEGTTDAEIIIVAETKLDLKMVVTENAETWENMKIKRESITLGDGISSIPGTENWWVISGTATAEIDESVGLQEKHIITVNIGPIEWGEGTTRTLGPWRNPLSRKKTNPGLKFVVLRAKAHIRSALIKEAQRKYDAGEIK